MERTCVTCRHNIHGVCQNLGDCVDENTNTLWEPRADPVNHPTHYTAHPSGVECIQVTEHMNFCLGNAVKYLWRAGLKDENATVEDLKKAVWYINREIERIEKNG